MGFSSVDVDLLGLVTTTVGCGFSSSRKIDKVDSSQEQVAELGQM
jgi:hypothetical protein